MSFLVAGAVSAEIRYGIPLDGLTEFLLDDLTVKAGNVAREGYESHVLETVGSVDWYSADFLDEMRFDPAGLLLSSVALRVPLQVVADPGGIPDSSVSRPGVIRLVDQRNFRLMSASVRLADTRLSSLVCSYGESVGFGAGAEVVMVSDGLHLIIEGGLLAGWMLDYPHSRLSEPGQDYQPSRDDPALEAALADYLVIVSNPAVDALLDGDRYLWRRLDGIVDHIPPGGGDAWRRGILRRRIQRLMDEWRD